MKIADAPNPGVSVEEVLQGGYITDAFSKISEVEPGDYLNDAGLPR